MKKLLILCLAIGVFPVANAQLATERGPADPPNLTLKSQKYHLTRLTDTTPTFELARVQKLMKSMKKKEDEGGDSGTEALSSKAFSSLTTAGKFTYCMLQGEDYGQNCDGMPAVLGEENKIFAQPPDNFSNEEHWSDRQTAFLRSHRASVIGLLRSTIRSHHEVGVNLKQAILEIDGYELIPDLVALYKQSGTDRDLLSVMSVLMKDGKYKPYKKSKLYKSFYGEQASYQTAVPYTRATAQFILDNALAFYKHRKA